MSWFLSFFFKRWNIHSKKKLKPLPLTPQPKLWYPILTHLVSFHLGFFQLYLYLCISIALKQMVQLVFYFPSNHLAWDVFDIMSWHLFNLFLQWCFFLPTWRRIIGHKKIKMHMKWFFFVIERSFELNIFCM